MRAIDAGSESYSRAERIRALERSRLLSRDLESLILALHKRGLLKGGNAFLPSLDLLVAPREDGRATSKDIHARLAAVIAEVQELLGDLGSLLTGVYQDGRVTEQQLEDILHARAGLEALLSLRDDRAEAKLPKDVRQRLERSLFLPLSVLSAITRSHSEALRRANTPRERPAKSRSTDGGDRTDKRRSPRSRSASGAKGKGLVVVVGGGAETLERVQTVRGKTGEGALYTTLGPTLEEHGIQYKDYNEDAALLGVLPSKKGRGELLLAGAFDQAGGMGQIPGQTGAASKLAAASMRQAAAQIQRGGDPIEELRAAAWRAHEMLSVLNAKHGVEAITTVATGVVQNGVATIANCGDSKVLHYSPDGELLNETKTHNLGDILAESTGNPNAGLNVSNRVTSALGSGEPPSVDTYQWTVGEGDWLLFISDGVGDANLEAQRAARGKKPWSKIHGEVTARELGALLRRADNAVIATRAVAGFALQKMARGKAKPDNITAVVLRITAAPRTDRGSEASRASV